MSKPVHNLLAAERPDLAAELLPDSPVLLSQLRLTSNKKSHWRCGTCGHDWWALVQVRVRSVAASKGCPACGGKVVTPETSLLLNFPSIATEYHPTLNARPVEEVTSRTTTRCWWQCSKNVGHKPWNTSPLNRTKQGDGCPYCGGRYATDEWNLAVIYPQVAAEWDCEVNGKLTPYDVTPKSHKKVGWKCAAGHRWVLSVDGRTDANGNIHRCRICTGYRADAQNCILVTDPKIGQEYDSDKNEVPVEKIRRGSTKKRWWRCEAFQHSWEATPASRTRKARPGNCPECSPTPRTSKIEYELREAIRAGEHITNVPETYNSFLPVDSGKHRSMQVDVAGAFRALPVAIEWDSWWWHSGAGSKQPYAVPAERDTRKTKALLAAGYAVVRIREERSDVTLPLLPLFHPNLLQLHYNYPRDDSKFGGLLNRIYAWLASLSPVC